MPIGVRLALRNMVSRRVRSGLTLAAIAFAVSLVVAVTTGFASLSAVATRMLDRFLGSADAIITAREVTRAAFDASVLDALRDDPRVRRVVPRFETPSPFLTASGEVYVGRNCWVVGLVPELDSGAANLRLLSGRWLGAGEDEVVLNRVAARMARSPESTDPDAPGLDVGDRFVLPGADGPLELTVVGVVHQPEIAGPNAYVNLRTLQQWLMPQGPMKVSRAMVEVRPGTDLLAFEADWATRLKAADPNIKFRLTRTTREQFESNLMGVTLLSALGVSVAMVSAACIVFSTLSMGVAERQRQLAMLRAVGASRRQIGAVVVAEGLTLAALGVAVGVPLGWLWVKLLATVYDQVFTEGVVLSGLGVGYAAAACLGTALLATLMPAWQATRVSPLEAMAPLAEGPRPGWPWRTALAGVACICVAPLNLSGLTGWLGGQLADPATVRGVQFFGHFTVGVPLIMAGFFLLSPMAIRAVEAAAVPAAASLLRLPRAVLRQQLSGSLWQTAGTACALMVGLSTLVVMQVQGNSGLRAWQLPQRFPDVFILHRGLGGLSEAQVAKLAEVPGLRPGELLPVAIASPQFGNNFLAIAGAAMMPDSTLFFGLDPELADKMTELEFRDGNREDAVRRLKQGRHVLITEEFRQLRGLRVGDTLELRTRTAGVVPFTVAGVVWSPGVDVIVGVFDMGGQFEQRTAYSVFGTLDDARELFGVREISIFAANVIDGVDREQLTRTLQQDVGRMGLQVFDIRQVKAAIERGLGNLLLIASSVAFAALFVASLGVTNTVMASIRSRQWQFGVLRAVGVTRGQLLRMVLAEGLMLSVAASALGLACGAWLTVNSRRMSRLMVGFQPEVVVPWGVLGVGVAAVLTVAVLASLYPAATTARRPVLALLQAGRSAT
ncbi:MAG: FtsX-like permease family protein [Tepidisphaerales bacterium]